MKTRSLFLVPLLVGALVGCGGGGISPTTNPLAGTYKGNFALDSGKTGALNIIVDSAGAAQGTLAVTAPSARGREGDSFSFTVGTTNVSGTVGTDGTVNVSGTDSGSGLFSVTGTLGATGGTLNIGAGGQIYTGTLSTNIGGGGGGAGGAITLGSGSGTNADLSNFPTNPLIFMSTVGDSSSIVASPPGGGNARTLLLLLGPNATPGESITYTGDPLEVNTLSYGEGTVKMWRAVSGTVKVNARTASTFELLFTNVRFEADSDTSATGSFVLNGTLSK